MWRDVCFGCCVVCTRVCVHLIGCDVCIPYGVACAFDMALRVHRVYYGVCVHLIRRDVCVAYGVGCAFEMGLRVHRVYYGVCIGFAVRCQFDVA